MLPFCSYHVFETWGAFYTPARLSSDRPHFNSHMWLAVTIPGSRGLDDSDIRALLGDGVTVQLLYSCLWGG